MGAGKVSSPIMVKSGAPCMDVEWSFPNGRNSLLSLNQTNIAVKKLPEPPVAVSE